MAALLTTSGQNYRGTTEIQNNKIPYLAVVRGVKTESSMKLSSFNFQWTKALLQNNLKNIVQSFFTFFKGSWKSEKMNGKFYKNYDYTGEIP